MTDEYDGISQRSSRCGTRSRYSESRCTQRGKAGTCEAGCSAGSAGEGAALGTPAASSHGSPMMLLYARPTSAKRSAASERPLWSGR